MTTIPDKKIAEISSIARQIRLDVLDMVYRRQSGNLGGSFSAAEILASLYFHQLRLGPENACSSDRDRLLLSKGHAAPALYSVLTLRGLMPREYLGTFRGFGSLLQGHPDCRKTPGVEIGAGPLGHGVAIGAGMALAARLDGLDYRTYVLLGDGELQAGIIWEGVMEAAKWHLDNLTAIVDDNGVQLDGPVAEIMPLEPLDAKWRAFGWHVIEADGHDVRSLLDALDAATRVDGKPTVVIAHTVKGKGVSFMEGKSAWHGRAPNKEQYEQAKKELEA